MGWGGVTQTHVRSASLEDTKSHSSSGRPSPSATTFWMALPTKPVPPVTRMRLDFGPAASVMATALCHGGGEKERERGGAKAGPLYGVPFGATVVVPSLAPVQSVGFFLLPSSCCSQKRQKGK